MVKTIAESNPENYISESPHEDIVRFHQEGQHLFDPLKNTEEVWRELKLMYTHLRLRLGELENDD